MDLNHGPSGYEPDELPDCSTPRCFASITQLLKIMQGRRYEQALILAVTSDRPLAIAIRGS